MPSFSKLRQQNPKQFQELVDYLGSLKEAK
jgi:hypothetical protein